MKLKYVQKIVSFNASIPGVQLVGSIDPLGQYSPGAHCPPVAFVEQKHDVVMLL